MEDYREIIAILKERLREKQSLYQEVKEEYSSQNVFEDGSFNSKIREKILEGFWVSIQWK